MVDRSIAAILKRVRMGTTDALDADILQDKLYPDKKTRVFVTFGDLLNSMSDVKELVPADQRRALARKIV